MKSCNVCIIRPEGYLWSSVFQEMAELIAFSIEDNGYQVKISENFLDTSALNIMIGCHLADISLIPQIPKNTIIFNTEQIGQGPQIWNERVIKFVDKFESWDYSLENIIKLKSLGIKQPKLFQFGYHPKLERLSNSQKEIDVLFYGSITPSRLNVLNAIEASGLKLKKIFGLFGAERDYYIERSKIILNLHQHDSKIFEIVRVHYLMNNSKVVVTQCDHDSKIDANYQDGVILSSHENIPNACLAAVQSNDILLNFEKKSLQTIKKLNSVQIMKNLLSEQN